MSGPSKPDMVHSPSHYVGAGGLEVIEVIEAFGLDKSFSLGSAAKYLLRAGKKGDAVEDLRKCVYFVSREIDRRQKGAEG